jgi:hypothetical protein
MRDMLIQGGCVVTPAGVGDGDLGGVGEKIVSVTVPGVLPAARRPRSSTRPAL